MVTGLKEIIIKCRRINDDSLPLQIKKNSLCALLVCKKKHGMHYMRAYITYIHTLQQKMLYTLITEKKMS